MIMAKNISTSADLNRVLADINLAIYSKNDKISIYCEDARASAFLQHILSAALNINLDSYMSFIDINLGWSNYVHLVEKEVPEFRNNLIVLDGDVLESKDEYSKRKKVIDEAGNILFLPLTIEKALFELLKNTEVFNRFHSSFSQNPDFIYDICFNSWPLEVKKYKSVELKCWYAQAVESLGGQECLFDFWCSEHRAEVDSFIDKFIEVFNNLADKNSVDAIPLSARKNETSEADASFTE